MAAKKSAKKGTKTVTSAKRGAKTATSGKTAGKRTAKSTGTRTATTAKGATKTLAKTSGTGTVTVSVKSTGSKTTNSANTSGGITYDTVTPFLVVEGASKAIAWYTKVFGAKELARSPLPDGKLMHAAFQIGSSKVMICDAFGKGPAAMAGAVMHIQDAGIDAMWDRAVANGAKIQMPIANQFWGDRYGQIVDPWGQLWSLGRAVTLTPAEQQRLQADAMKMFATGPQ